MKLPCEIIDDLLPLYEDGVCNETTKDAVREHLDSCPRCRGRMTENTLSVPEAPFEDAGRESAAAKKSFQKVKRVWITSLAVVLAVALLISGGAYVYIRALLPLDYAACLAQGEEFIRHLRDGEFEEAIVMVPMRYESEQWLSFHRKEFVDAMEDCWDQGILIESYNGFAGYDPNTVQEHDPGAFYYFNTEYNYYHFKISIRLSSGEVVDATLSLAFRNGKMCRLTLLSVHTEDIGKLEEALAHSELIPNLLYSAN